MGSRMMSLGLVKIYICSDGQDVFSPRKGVEENEEVEENGERQTKKSPGHRRCSGLFVYWNALDGNSGSMGMHWMEK